MADAPLPARKNDVFISYSRRDKPFVQSLDAALRRTDRDPWIDWDDIQPTEDWWDAIQRGIEGADTFVFVVSPDSVISKVCTQEVDHAVACNKRLVPIVYREGFDTSQVHPAIARHNWLFFRESDDFEVAFQTLLKAIDTNLDYVQAHTRLLLRAIDWDKHNRDESYLLRGKDLETAEAWLTESAHQTPQANSLQEDYIHTSRVAQESHQILLAAGQKARRMVRLGAGIMGVTLAIAAAAGVAAQRRVQQADQQVVTANQQVQVASQQVTQIRTDAANRTQEADRRVKAAIVRQGQAEQKVRQAQQQLTQVQTSLTQVNQQATAKIAAARRQVQVAQGQATQARQAVAQAQRMQQQLQQQNNAATAAIAEKATALQKLDMDLRQAQNQISLAERALTESIGDTPSRIAKVTGQTPAFVYINFIPLTPGKLQDDDPLGLLLVTDEGKPQRLQVPDLTRAKLMQTIQRFRSQVTDPRRIRTTSYLPPAQQLYDWLIRPLEPTLQQQKVRNLVFLTDPALRTIPIAALHDGRQFLIERYSIGMMPGLTLTDARYVDLRQAPVLAMGISSFQDQPPLPSVPVEITAILNQRAGKAIRDQAATLENLRRARQQQPTSIIHLATHAEFRSGQEDGSYIQFWDTKMRLSQIENLGWYNPPVELLVLSACRTVVGDASTKYGFAGLAVRGGVKSVLGSLWYISDVSTLALMAEFYGQLRTAPTRSEALRRAQLAMLRGRVRIENNQLYTSSQVVPLPQAVVDLNRSSMTSPYDWAGWTIVGNPW